MNMFIRKILVIAAIIFSCAIVQTAWAQDIQVTGTIARIGAASIDVTSSTGTYTFYDIPFSDLYEEGIVLSVSDEVTVSAYVVTFPNGTSKNIAYSITVSSDTTYSWHPNVPKAGTNIVKLSATNEKGQPCLCQCIEATECYECKCYCGTK